MCSESYHASWLIQDGSNLPFRKIDFDPRIRVSDLLLCLCFRLFFCFNGFRFWCLIGPRTMKIEEYKRRGSSIRRKSNESKKAIITITVGTVFGFYVGSSTCIKIQALASYRDYTYAAYGHDIGVLNRAHQNTQMFESNPSKVLGLLDKDSSVSEVDVHSNVLLVVGIMKKISISKTLGSKWKHRSNNTFMTKVGLKDADKNGLI
ncbi:hypothetical protein QVD17_12230 [Tagetes erecta]|uniref:Uncharacterized protein n=1 Tax=Tagetes erecta TaxID=13708 RepID=A0AAD8P2Q2_TARER|nr:hypothetical protein QVD17_12230 [Tagetes erecta]